MAYVDKININNTSYIIKDSEARSDINYNLLPCTIGELRKANTSGTWAQTGDLRWAYSISGATLIIDVNAEGSVNSMIIHASSSTADITFNLLTGTLELEEGTYHLSGCPSGGSSSTYYLQVRGNAYRDYGDGTDVPITGSLMGSSCKLVIKQGVNTGLGLTVYPMLTRSGYKGFSYKPYDAALLMAEKFNALIKVASAEETVSGEVAYMECAEACPARECVVTIEAQQSGSGDPSPTNVRPISGWTEVTVSRSGADTSNPDTTTISLTNEAGTVYGGELDVVRGVLTVTHAMVDLGALNNWIVQNGVYCTRVRTIDLAQYLKRAASNNDTAGAICTSYTEKTPNQTYSGNIGISLEMNGYISIYDPAFSSTSTTEEIKTYLNGVKLVYPLVTPMLYSLTPRTIQLLNGENNVWADCGSTKVTYKIDLQTYING